MYEYNIAYRHKNGDIEGFKGSSIISEDAAKADAFSQIRTKLADIVFQTFEPNSVFTDVDGLSKEEYDQVKADWKSKVRY